MSLSYFRRAELVEHAAGRQGFRQINVSGPLTGINPLEYEAPFVFRISIMQNPENDHDPRNAKRVSAYTTLEEARDGEWEVTIDVPDGVFDFDRPARGIGVAVLGRTEGYTSEVLTWCDHLFDLDGSATKEEAEEKAAARAAAASTAGTQSGA